MYEDAEEEDDDEALTAAVSLLCECAGEGFDVGAAFSAGCGVELFEGLGDACESA
jgi:hypothetical protein